jgi:uncharacterized membrane protein
VRTSQVTVQLEAKIDTGLTQLLDSQISVPIYIVAAEGTAAVQGIPCAPGGNIAVLSGTTGAVAARYGTESDTSPPIARAELNVFPLGTIPVVELSAEGSYTAAASGPSNVEFSQSNIDNGDMKTVSSSTSVFSGLGGSLDITEAALLGGIDLTWLLSVVVPALKAAITSALTPLDAVIDSLLTTLGVKLGAMDMIVHGAKCRAPTLVS